LFRGAAVRARTTLSGPRNASDEQRWRRVNASYRLPPVRAAVSSGLEFWKIERKMFSVDRERTEGGRLINGGNRFPVCFCAEIFSAFHTAISTQIPYPPFSNDYSAARNLL
jgi:hypothetical protein